MNIHQVEFPEGFDDYAWEVESKGWLQGVIVIIDNHRYSLTFYDPVRLRQDVEAELNSAPAFFEPNLVIVPAVTRKHIESAVDVIAKTGRYLDLLMEGKDDVRQPASPPSSQGDGSGDDDRNA
jgi:hypothetical protein